MKHYFALLLFLPLGLFATEWNPFPLNQKSIYSGTRYAHLMVADSVELVNGKYRYMINSKRSVLGAYECEDYLKAKLEDKLKWYKNAWTINEYEYLTSSDTIFLFDNFYLLKYPQLNQEWEITTPANEKLKISCTFIGTESFLGITDSVKVFKINGSKYQNFPFILSKSYGFIHFPDLNNFKTPTANINYYTLFGFENNNNTIGFQLPEFIDYFNYSIGDVIMWEIEGNDLNPSINYILKYFRDSITQVLKTADSVIYTFNRESYDYSTYEKKYNLTKRWLKTEWGNILNPITWWYSTQSMNSPFAGERYIWGLSNHKIDIYGQDTILSFNAETDYMYIELRDNQCKLTTTTDNVNSYNFNSKQGVTTICHHSFTSVCTTLVGSIVNGTHTGRTSLPLSINAPDKSSFKLFPVPAKDKLYVVNENLSSFKFIIYDLKGREVMNGTSKDEIDISGLRKGVYFLSLNTWQGVYYKKFMKE